MSVKHYGIFLAYGPLVDLRFEGLGRHLAAFLRAAQKNQEFHLTIACPQWMAKNLRELCLQENIDSNSFTLITPPGAPVLLNALFVLRYGSNVLLRRARNSGARLVARRTVAAASLPGTAPAAEVVYQMSVGWHVSAIGGFFPCCRSRCCRSP